MRLIIVRHGETKANASGIWQGQLHGSLTSKGRAQVKALGRLLKDEKIDVIYSSDLRRAAHTTRAIAKFHSVPVHHVKALREMNLGIHEGKPYRVFSYQADAGHINLDLRPKGGESHKDVKRRIKAFISLLSKKHKDETVLISTHGIVIKCLVSVYLGKTLDEMLKVHPRNAGFLILDVKGAKARKIKDEIFDVTNRRTS